MQVLVLVHRLLLGLLVLGRRRNFVPIDGIFIWCLHVVATSTITDDL